MPDVYSSGLENGPGFRAQRSVRMHIRHMHISIIMFIEMGVVRILSSSLPNPVSLSDLWLL